MKRASLATSLVIGCAALGCATSAQSARKDGTGASSSTAISAEPLRAGNATGGTDAEGRGDGALSMTLPGTDGSLHALSPRSGESLLVLIFFSPGCHVLETHEDRLRAWVSTYAPRGVRFLAVDSEAGGSLDVDREEASRRGYPFPIVRDQGAELAQKVGAEYAGYTVVLDASGAIRYRGGLDSDRVHLRDDATLFLSDALSDLLAGRAPRHAETKSLGCALRLR